MEVFGYIASIFMGLTLGLIGGGGSILTVPILVYLFSIQPMIATSSSLFVVGTTALLGATLALKRNEVNLKTGLLFAIPSFLGVYLTKTIIVPMIPDQIFSIQDFTLTKPLLIMSFFAILMLLASLAMIRKKRTIVEKQSPQNSAKITSVITQGLMVGGVTGVVGAGGGFLIVPALVNIVGLSMREAIGTSLMIIAANSLFGFSVAISNGLEVNWNLLLSILSVSIIGLVIGSYFSKKVPEKKLKMGFGYFILIMGSIILIDQLKRL